MIKKIILNEELRKHYKIESTSTELTNLNQLNIFIGANNTGKSRFLRSLFADKTFGLETTDFEWGHISRTFASLLEELELLLDKGRYEDISSQNIPGLKSELKKRIKNLEQVSLNDINDMARDTKTFWSWLKTFHVTGAAHKPNIISTGMNLDGITNTIRNIIAKYNDLLSVKIPEQLNYQPNRVYLPILRGLRPTQLHDGNKFDEIQDNYLKRTIRDYFMDVEIKDEEIFTGLRLYNDTKKMLLGKRDERDKIRKFEAFLSNTFFNNEPFTLIPNIEDDSLHVSIGAEEWPIYRLGDGIQSIIILLYPLFFNQDNDTLVFIEEPENSMHPGLQRLFLETITQKSFKNFQYFITTHSNHFLDFTVDIPRISVYTFNKIRGEAAKESLYQIENTSYESTNILDLIGARTSSVLLSNCTIWVEGITDRLYIKKYLELYQKHLRKSEIKNYYKEDFNFSFIEYGGNNITHWAFGDEATWEKIKANKISSKVFLLADTDSTTTKKNSEKAKRIKLLKDLFGKNFQTVGGREIENILGPKILITTLKLLEKDKWSKVLFDENKLRHTDYLNKPLGRFIAKKFQNLSRKYEAASGTIFCKLDFCRAATTSLENFEDLSSEAQELTKKIYAFIESSNRK